MQLSHRATVGTCPQRSGWEDPKHPSAGEEHPKETEGKGLLVLTALSSQMDPQGKGTHSSACTGMLGWCGEMQRSWRGSRSFLLVTGALRSKIRF